MRLFVKREKYHVIPPPVNTRSKFRKGSWTSLEVSICKLVFTNKDGTAGETYLASNDAALSGDQFKTLEPIEKYPNIDGNNLFLGV